MKPGDTVGRYRLVKRLGGGTFGEVWRVRHSILHDTRAIKLLHPAWIDRPEVRDRFVNEGRILAQLRHPNLIRVNDILLESDTQGQVGLVMDYIDGTPLSRLITEHGSLSPALSVQLILQVLHGLHEAHEHGIVHRDLKPDNILVEHTMAGVRAVIIDFGIARLTADNDIVGGEHASTSAGTRLGTPNYMAPEQIEATQPIDRRADIFAAGCVFFEMLSGSMAFEGENATETMYRIISGDHTDFSALSPCFAGILTCALSTSPHARYATAHAMAEALSRCAEPGSEVFRGRPPPPARDLALTEIDAPAAPAQPTAIASEERGRGSSAFVLVPIRTETPQRLPLQAAFALLFLLSFATLLHQQGLLPLRGAQTTLRHQLERATLPAAPTPEFLPTPKSTPHPTPPPSTALPAPKPDPVAEAAAPTEPPAPRPPRATPHRTAGTPTSPELAKSVDSDLDAERAVIRRCLTDDTPPLEVRYGIGAQDAHARLLLLSVKALDTDPASEPESSTQARSCMERALQTLLAGRPAARGPLDRRFQCLRKDCHIVQNP